MNNKDFQEKEIDNKENIIKDMYKGAISWNFVDWYFSSISLL